MDKNVSRKIRSDTELQKASDRLYYEIFMFQSLVNGMVSGIAGESVINNALLESFGIHTRALLWFFYTENSRDDDVIADDFFPTPTEWQLIRPPLTDILDRAKKRADKEIVHPHSLFLGIITMGCVENTTSPRKFCTIPSFRG